LLYSVLQFLVFVRSASPSSSRFRQIAPSLPIFSAPSTNAASKSPRNPSSQLPQPAEPPTDFPLFPHPVNMAHTQTPANPFPSIVYFTLLCIPGVWGTSGPIRSTPLPGELRSRPTTPLDATLTENQGGPSGLASPPPSLFTTHYPLLTSPIISLHYPFEAHHDS
jgi:hypothetical protein